MHPAIRTQVKPAQKLLSRLTAITCHRDLTRQEGKQEADINFIMARVLHGNAPTTRQGYEGEIDYEVDLTSALQAAENAKRGYYALPAHLRAKYPSWWQLMAAIDRGEVTSIKPPEKTPEKVADPPQPPKA